MEDVVDFVVQQQEESKISDAIEIIVEEKQAAAVEEAVDLTVTTSMEITQDVIAEGIQFQN